MTMMETPALPTLKAADEDSFENLTPGCALTVATGHEPDFETKPSYSISITATDSNDRRRCHMARDQHAGRDRHGRGRGRHWEVSFVQREPQVDKTITAKVSDPDGGVTNTKWQWARLCDQTVTTVPRPAA